MRLVSLAFAVIVAFTSTAQAQYGVGFGAGGGSCASGVGAGFGAAPCAVGVGSAYGAPLTFAAPTPTYTSSQSYAVSQIVSPQVVTLSVPYQTQSYVNNVIDPPRLVATQGIGNYGVQSVQFGGGYGGGNVGFAQGGYGGGFGNGFGGGTGRAVVKQRSGGIRGVIFGRKNITRTN